MALGPISNFPTSHWTISLHGLVSRTGQSQSVSVGRGRAEPDTSTSLRGDRCTAVTRRNWLDLARQTYWNVRVGKLPMICFRWPIYDIWRHFINAESRRLYLQQYAAIAPGPSESKIIEDLRRDGIAVVALDELLPEPKFSEIQYWGDHLLEAPDV